MNAPIALFVYNRPEHTTRTIEALAKNKLSSETDIFVFSDGPKNDADKERVDSVRAVCRQIKGFKNVKIIERDENLGLASNITLGINHVFRSHTKIIVVEDDILTSSHFIKFMNDALNLYADKPMVWHVNGWNYPIATSELPDVYFSKTMNCWGWATWKDRWEKKTNNLELVIKKWNIKKKFQFNQDGSYPFYSQILANIAGKRKTWAIYWYATIFDSAGLCVTPASTLTNEIGSDGSGTHKLNNALYISNLSSSVSWKFPSSDLEENNHAKKLVVNFNKKNYSITNRLLNLLKLITPYKLMIRILG